MIASRKRKAFTLAEVLITLAVIGVVAALTIPAVLKSFEEAQNRTGAKNGMSIVSQALNTMIADNNLPDFSATGNNDDLRNKYCEYLKCLKTGPTSEIFAPFYNYYKNSNNGWDFSSLTHSALVLNNGMLVSFNNYQNNCTTPHYAATSVCGYIFMDTNGSKSPNMWGKDLLFFLIKKENNQYIIIPGGSKDHGTPPCTAGSDSPDNNYGCTVYYFDGRELP